jgi:UDP-N-acetylglucosamine enolpyruvyl transferase
VEDVQYIERGYQNLVGKLRRLGAEIALVTEEEPKHISISVAG